jgi:AcrR family transcriptional regulator
VLDAVSVLVSERGLAGVTVAGVAERSGVDQTILGKYFGGVEAMLREWHDRQVGNHLAYLADSGDEHGDPMVRLERVLRSYAAMLHQTAEHRTTELGAWLHRDEHLHHAREQLHALIHSLVAEGAAAGIVRDDVAPEILADSCIRAMSTATDLRSATAVRELVADTLGDLSRITPSDADLP